MITYTIGAVSKDYPDAVQELVNTTMEVAYHYNIMEDVDPTVLEELLCESALQKFLTDGEMRWDEDEFVDTVGIATAHTHINHLKKLGFVDSIEDEKGDEIIWVTDKGKELVTTIRTIEKEDE